jgi:hypothetical protein
MCSRNPYESFNIDQLIPILTDLHTGKAMVAEIINVLSAYRDNLYEITSELKDANYVTDELKTKIDKNVTLVMNEVQSVLQKCVSLKNTGKHRGTLLERLKRGITYKYKLCNGVVAENPETFVFDAITVDAANRLITIGPDAYQLSDADDQEPGFESGSVFELASEIGTGTGGLTADAILAKFIAGLGIEVSKVLVLQSQLDVISSELTYFIDIIETDIKHFDLFDIECLASTRFY